MKKNLFSRKDGFTLVELMVVMAIIAVLAVLIFTAINVARQGSANTTRQSDAKTFQAALESYYASNKKYPGTVNTPTSVYNETAGTARALLSAYLPSFNADDPKGSAANRRVQYCRKSDTTYNLYVVGEPAPVPAAACAVPGSGAIDFSIK